MTKQSNYGMWPIYVINNNGAKIRDFYGLFGEWPRFQVLSFRLLSFIPKKIERKWGGRVLTHAIFKMKGKDSGKSRP